MKNLVFVRDENCVLHNDDGPSILYPGNAFWYFNRGVISRTDGPAVDIFTGEEPKYLIDAVPLNDATAPDGKNYGRIIVENPEGLTPEIVDGIENAEILRIAIERMGVGKYLEMANAEVIDEQDNDIEMTKEVLMKTATLTVFVGICRSTGRMYYITVSDDCKTLNEARSYMSSGLDLKKCVGAS